MKEVIKKNLKKRYDQPYCEIFAVAAECQVATGSSNLPGGSSGTDLGGGEDEEPITIGTAKSINMWE